MLKEVRSVIPGYGVLGPAPIPPKVDPAAVERYSRETIRKDIATRYSLAPRRRRLTGPLWHMSLKQSLFHSGKLSTRAKGLIQIEDKADARDEPEEAERLSVADGDRVRVSNGRGELMTTVKVRGTGPGGNGVVPRTLCGRASLLFDCTVDPSQRCLRLERQRSRSQGRLTSVEAACNTAVVQRAKRSFSWKSDCDWQYRLPKSPPSWAWSC